MVNIGRVRKDSEDVLLRHRDKFWLLHHGTDAHEIISCYPQTHENCQNRLQDSMYIEMGIRSYAIKLLKFVISNVNSSKKILFSLLRLMIKSNVQTLKSVGRNPPSELDISIGGV